jgi:hypothetical protein
MERTIQFTVRAGKLLVAKKVISESHEILVRR